MAVLDTNILVNYYFEEISKIPHGSYNEKAISDYIVSIAKQYNLKYYQDDMNNVIVYKDASQGYEDHEPVLLEAHMDMVCEKNNDSNHDFFNDPLDLYVDDGNLYARGTTLGADDGYGVCYMLALLTDLSLKHPPLECLFTVQEEVGLLGAMAIDESKISAKRMIGLDSETEGETCTSSSGGNEVYIYRKYNIEENSDPVYCFEIKGLLGGHSGACIHLARGNANKLCARALMMLLKNGIDVRLVDITGGLKSNAIPRECVCTFASKSDDKKIIELLTEFEKVLQKEFENSDNGVCIEFEYGESDCAISSDDSQAIITMMYLCLNGLIERSQVIEDLTTVSLNMGIVRMENDMLTITYSMRSPLQSVRKEMAQQIDVLVSIFNAYTEISNEYPGWDYDSKSVLRKQLKDFYLSYTKKELKEVATHGGLETGVLKGKIPELDIVTYGPDMSDIHTPDERLNIDSFVRNYEFVVKFLEIL